MERVNIKIGPVVFDHADFDVENDVLYPTNLHTAVSRLGKVR